MTRALAHASLDLCTLKNTHRTDVSITINRDDVINACARNVLYTCNWLSASQMKVKAYQLLVKCSYEFPLSGNTLSGNT